MKKSVLFVLMLCCASVTWGWTCPANQHWVQVSAGTPGATVVEGITFQCQSNTPPSSGTVTNTNNNQNTLNSSNTNTNQSTSTSTSTSNSSSNQSQKQAQKQKQSQVANGGNSTSNATGGTSSAQAANNGNNSNNTTVEAPKIPVSSANAPMVLPSAPCIKGYSGAAQTMAFGASFGAGKIDEGCDIRETARAFSGISKLAQCKLLVNEKQAKKAGITLEDCMGPVVVAIAVPVAVVAPPVVTPQEVVVRVVEAPRVSTEAYQGFFTKSLDNASKARLDSTVLLLKNNLDSHLRLRFNRDSIYLVAEINTYLIKNGIDKERIEARGDGYERGVEVLFIN